MELKLDFILVANSAFFDEDGRLNIIQIIDIFKGELNKEGEKLSLPRFSVVGKVVGNYGDGVILELVSPSSKVLIEETKIQAKAKNKPHFNFILDVFSSSVSEVGNYSVRVKTFSKKIISERVIFSVESNS
jgi:hypothetical protein